MALVLKQAVKVIVRRWTKRKAEKDVAELDSWLGSLRYAAGISGHIKDDSSAYVLGPLMTFPVCKCTQDFTTVLRSIFLFDCVHPNHRTSPYSIVLDTHCQPS